jgi:hypothetical protein
MRLAGGNALHDQPRRLQAHHFYRRVVSPRPPIGHARHAVSHMLQLLLGYRQLTFVPLITAHGVFCRELQVVSRGVARSGGWRISTKRLWRHVKIASELACVITRANRRTRVLPCRPKHSPDPPRAMPSLYLPSSPLHAPSPPHSAPRLGQT